MKELPVEAQFSTLNGLIVDDFNKDGQKDLLIAGNKYDVEVETTPADASPGFFLKATGNFNFKSYKPFESGFFVPYNVKDLKSIKVGDETIILVTSNDDRLRLFKVLK